jgi:murein DD-endopeptidase MepM/ murein hydrolase activator NlpD
MVQTNPMNPMRLFLKINFLFIALSLALAGCYISKDPQRSEIKKLQKGIIKDDSSYVYQLPYEIGNSHLLVQGYFSRYSHRNRAALDFKMKKGTKVLAARSGVVIRVKEDGNKGGWNKKYRPFGNMIVIQHEDNSRAGYWHLQYNGALVNVGDTVKQGQVIGLSGKTGYTLFPHLHFIAWRSAVNGWQQVATRFQTAKGIRYLRPFRFYRKNLT